jgi:hypothetical protein
MMLFLTFFLFSESDVAFVIKYQFHDSVDQPSGYETEDKNKKKKGSATNEAPFGYRIFICQTSGRHVRSIS